MFVQGIDDSSYLQVIAPTIQIKQCSCFQYHESFFRKKMTTFLLLLSFLMNFLDISTFLFYLTC